MKLRPILVAVALAGMAGVACAAGQGNVMPAVNVHAVGISACTPPNGAMGRACDSYNAFLHANFSPEEIRALFGCQSCGIGYLAGNTARLERRYDTLLEQYLAVHAGPGGGGRVAAK